MLRRYYIIIALLLLVRTTFAQEGLSNQLDSLQYQLKNANNDTNRASILDEIAVHFSSLGEYDSAINYSRNSLELAKKSGWRKGMQLAHERLGKLYISTGEFGQALHELKEPLNYYQEVKDTSGLIDIYFSMGVVYDFMTKYSDALKFYLRSLKLSRITKSKEGELKALFNIGNLYSNIDDYEKSINYQEKALKIIKELGYELKEAKLLYSMAIGYNNRQEYEIAFKHNTHALAIFKKLNEDVYAATVEKNIALYHLQKENYPQALELIKQSNNIFKEVENWEEVFDNYVILADIHLRNAVDSNSEKEYQLSKSEKQKNLNRSIRYLDSAKLYLKKEETSNLYLLSYLYEISANIYEAADMSENALESYKSYMNIQDSIYARDEDKKVAELEGKIAVAEKEEQIKLKEQLLVKKRNERWYLVGGIAFLILVLMIIYRNYAERGRMNKELNAEKNKSEELLHNILPEEVASDLKERGATTAQYFDKVSVLFTDFVGFTKVAEKLTSQELVNELHVCFKAFDEISDKYNIEKIKTVGDAYMAVCGLPVGVETHAENAVSAAIEMLSFMQSRQEEVGDRTFKIRIGIHSGDVVAGIVGVKKFAYDIWGDTVNTAARMEQNSKPDRINISETTYKLVESKFECMYRGELEAKNKGKLKMYFVEV